VVVLEEHSVLGGLGSTIAEIAAESAPVRFLRVGVQDRFSQYCGTYDYLLREHGLDREAVAQRIAAFVEGT
jgi:transketolase